MSFNLSHFNHGLCSNLYALILNMVCMFKCQTQTQGYKIKYNHTQLLFFFLKMGRNLCVYISATDSFLTGGPLRVLGENSL